MVLAHTRLNPPATLLGKPRRSRRSASSRRLAIPIRAVARAYDQYNETGLPARFHCPQYTQHPAATASPAPEATAMTVSPRFTRPAATASWKAIGMHALPV